MYVSERDATCNVDLNMVSSYSSSFQNKISDSTMTISFLCGILGDITRGLAYLAPVNTFWHIIQQRSTEEFESIPYIFNLLNAYFWTYYGIIKPDSLVLAAVNGFGAVLQIVFVIIFLIYAPPKTRVRTAILAITCDVVFPAATILVSIWTLDRQLQITVSGLLGAALSLVAYGSPLSAMKTVVTTKSVEYMPFLLSFILFINGGVWIVYAVLTKDIFLGVPNGIGLGLGAAQLILYAIYYKPKSSRESTNLGDEENGCQQHDQPLLSSSSSGQ